MGHLLVVESWVGSMSRLLPRAIREGGHEFTFLTRDLHHYLRAAPGLPGDGPHPLLAARNVVTADTNDVDALLPLVERLHEVLGFDGVVSSCDYYLPAVARIAERLGLPGPTVLAVEAACHKGLTRRVLAEAAVPGPRFAVCGDAARAAAAAREIGYPLVVKPVDLCGGMLVREVRDERELDSACRALSDFPVNARGQERSPVLLLEELLTGPEVSVETVSFGGATHVVGVTDKSIGGAPAFIETGHMFPAGMDPALEREAVDTAVAAINALGLDHVVCHTEIKLTPRGPRVVEVNPRPAGNRITELVRHVTGVDLAAACLDVALGRRPDLTPRPTGVHSAAVAFLLPETTGTLAGIDGADDIRERREVLELALAEPGRTVRAATSNNEYLGHLMTADTGGGGAREIAERLLSRLRPTYVEGAAEERAPEQRTPDESAPEGGPPQDRAPDGSPPGERVPQERSVEPGPAVPA
ncbi:ATP-grasp domain-containing protein [Streptomyces sp. H34-S4]|uniref:ATP-grasp domain-containing protein n=1 Tax=Streptomyces sp. H34-S4 TaxID=2996463 RepID=UPI002270360D|nr:ATP-grasp domain-containing protein [Streptomyces sp. H34-S4]MCY0934978.1 ATP-grasp domain-containing protein [Streptomyces sp. H34-S4]